MQPYNLNQPYKQRNIYVTLTVYKISYKKEVINIKFLKEEGLYLTLMKYVLTHVDIRDV